jgi:3-oxosteroid 1-dehydrogenase
VLDGLYAAGNNTASVMGHTYPGPGSSISPAGVFGYLGALHAARRSVAAALESDGHPVAEVPFAEPVEATPLATPIAEPAVAEPVEASVLTP